MYPSAQCSEQRKFDSGYNQRSLLDYSMPTAAGVPQSQAGGAAAFAHCVPFGCARQLSDADQAQDGVVVRAAEQAQANDTGAQRCSISPLCVQHATGNVHHVARAHARVDNRMP